MQRDNPLTQIRIRAHLYGRSQAGHVISAVLEALRPHVPEPTFRDLVNQLPADIQVPTSARDSAVTTGGCDDFVADIGRRLHIGTTDAVFYARVTFEQLNAYCRGVSPATIAPSLPSDMRALLTARAEDPSLRSRLLLRTLGSAAATLSLGAPVPGDQPVEVALEAVPRFSV
jgi:uncharacterized protein (DUF2267 family)